MTTPSTEQSLEGLLERVKTATGPDFQLDQDIATTIGGYVYEKRGRDTKPWFYPVKSKSAYDRCDYFSLPRYTGSIDDTKELVKRLLPEAMLRVFDNPDDGSVRAEIVTGIDYGKGDHDTWPLAILAALLSSLKETPNDHE